MLTAWAQWIPRAATRWESNFKESSVVSALLCPAPGYKISLGKLKRALNVFAELYYFNNSFRKQP